MSADDQAAYVASQWQLIWWKFRKHRLAMLAVTVLGLLYLVAVLCEFLSPYGPLTRFPEFLDAPPQRIRVFEAGAGLRAPFVYGIVKSRDPDTFRRIYPIDREQVHPVRLLVRGEPYKFWGLFETDLHLFGVEGSTILLLGTDRLGRDLFTRILHGRGSPCPSAWWESSSPSCSGSCWAGCPATWAAWWTPSSSA